MSQQRPNARRTSKRPTVARGEQKQVSGQSEPSSLPSIRPSNDDHVAWSAYWQEQNQPWRTQPEISPERRVELEKRRVLVPDVKKGIYPFKGMKLDRADVEWLLATYDGGPVKWSDEQEREREGLDVRGADLQQADLYQLPLTRLRGGLTYGERLETTEEQRSSAVVLMRGAILSEAQLQGADLYQAQLQGAILSEAQLQGADLSGAQLQGAALYQAQLEEANLRKAQLQGANLRNVMLGDKKRIGPRLADLQWGDTNLAVADWSQVAVLGDEREARQKKTPGGEKKEKAVRLSEYQAAVRANRQLAVALQTQGLSEEAARFAYRASSLQRKVFWYQIFLRSKREGEKQRLPALAWQWLVGITGRVRKLGSYVFSLFLYMLAGYGYRPGRTLGWYVLIVLSYAGVYFKLEHVTKLHLSFIGALIFSITAFHGRGFFPGGFGYDDLVTILAAMEAVVGLLIELSFIATFTQRFLGK
jgi:uncharacterized protein YjbI with pentapeptide repeats